MKIKSFFAIALVLCMFLTACSSSFNLDKSVEKIEKLGFVVFNSDVNDDLNKSSALLNSEIKLMGGDFTVELDKAVSLSKETNDYYGCLFFDFKNDEQAKSYYDLYLKTRLKDNHYKLHLAKDIVVLTNSQEVIDALGFQFK